MSFTRANAATYLVGQYGTGVDSLLVLAGIGLTDVSGGLKEIIDEALFAAGVAFGDLATATIVDDDVSDAWALLRYTALRKVYTSANAVELRGDLTVEGLKLTGLKESVANAISLERAELIQRGLISTSPRSAAFLGGHSVSDVEARDLDTGITQPFFTRQTGNNPFGSRWPNPGVWR